MVTKEVAFIPMKAQDVHHLVDRAYREGAKYLWARETLVNAIEAGATKIAFEIEDQAVRNKRVFRRMIADNGKGMDAGELLAYFNTFGGGGKPIGGEHDNYGIGSKTSLLPWNPHGVVVVSWKNGSAAMIWLHRNESTGEYGLRGFDCEDSAGDPTLENAILPPEDFDDYGCDWAAVKPDWIGRHGTVIVLLGEGPKSDSVLGDVSRREDCVDGLTRYINTRIWTIPKGVSVQVRELTHRSKHNWPSEIGAESGERRLQLNRTILGARKYLFDPGSRKHTGGKLEACGTLDVPGGTKLHWVYWTGERPEIGAYAQKDGYIAAVYRDELYSVTSHAATYKMFGIASQKVRSRVWIIAEPPSTDGSNEGVYPRADRNCLLMRGGKHAGRELPFSDWGQFFSENMPTVIREALLAERSGGGASLEDPAWRDKLASVYGSRWRIRRNFLRPGAGNFTGQAGRRATPGAAGGAPEAAAGARKKRSAARPAHGDRPTSFAGSGPLRGEKESRSVCGGLPKCVWVSANEFDNPHHLASYCPNDPIEPDGVIQLNAEHPIILDVVKHWQDQYPLHFADVIEKEVRAVYGIHVVARVAHSQSMRSFFPSARISEEFHSDSALTMSLLGLVAEDGQIATRVGGRCGIRGQRRKA